MKDGMGIEPIGTEQEDGGDRRTQEGSFFQALEEAEGAWEPGGEYTMYHWWLARTGDGSWQLITFGY